LQIFFPLCASLTASFVFLIVPATSPPFFVVFLFYRFSLTRFVRGLAVLPTLTFPHWPTCFRSLQGSVFPGGGSGPFLRPSLLLNPPCDSSSLFFFPPEQPPVFAGGVGPLQPFLTFFLFRQRPTSIGYACATVFLPLFICFPPDRLPWAFFPRFQPLPFPFLASFAVRLMFRFSPFAPPLA